jgi:uncharacterized phage-associated protein
MIIDEFNVRKAAQVAAFFARAAGGRINVLKLSKLIYLADREFASRHDEPMLFDHLVSMDHGPVNSSTLDLINGMAGPNRDWDEFVAPRSGYDVPLARELSDGDFDELSAAEVAVLKHTWVGLGGLNQYELRDYTHKNCPEWEDPHGTSSPIPYSRLYKFLGKADAEGLAEIVENVRSIERSFKSSVDVAWDQIPTI